MTDQDITPAPFPQLSWKQEDVDASLDELAGWVEGQATRAIAWYLDAKRPKARLSRALRCAAIAFATIGAAVPFVAALMDGMKLEWGYLAFALAGAAMAFDRFFGLSTAWMRYITAELALQGILQRFRLQRATLRANRVGPVPRREDMLAELELLASTAEAIHAEVARETLKWVSEFQSNVSELTALARGPKQPDGGGGSA